MNGIDLNLPIHRDTVEKLHVFTKLNQHLDEALEKAKITKS
jgi:hypothetical protein